MCIFKTTIRRSVALLTICFTASAVMCSSPTAFAYAAQASPGYYTLQQLDGLIAGIIEWKQGAEGAASVASLLEEKLSTNAGDFVADWYAMSIARMEPDPDYPVYLDKLMVKVAELYRTGDKEKVPATDFHRIALTMLALGGDPRNIINGTEAQRIDLISDFTYNRGLTTPLDKQGISGLLWGLITLDAMQYEISAGGFYTRGGIILKILENQKPDGGFSLSGAYADPDITAMAVQALSPYYNSAEAYKYKRLYDGAGQEHSVREAVDIALTRLSAMQKDTGDYSSWGNRNSQTGAQVMLALCCLGIDPQKDSRFIKKGATLMDGVMLYRMEDKGFANSLKIPVSNSNSNSKSTEQILYTFIAMRRQMAGMRTLFDMRPEQSSTLKKRIAGIIGDISEIDGSSPHRVLDEINASYASIPQNERFYVYNYVRLSDELKNFDSTDSSSVGGSSVIADSAVASPGTPDETTGVDQSVTSGEASGSASSPDAASDGNGSSDITYGSSRGSLPDGDTTRNGRFLLITVIAAAVLLSLAVTGFIRRKHKGGNKS